MKSFSIQTTIEELSQAVDACLDIDPTLVIIFAAPEVIQEDEFLSCIKNTLSDVQVIGCSTAGEIGIGGVNDSSISLVAAHFDRTEVKCVTSKLASGEQSFEAGQQIAEQLSAPDLKSVFSLCPGTNVNGSEYVKGINETLAEGVISSGGLAGDGADFKQTYTLLNGKLYRDQVVAFGLYGDAVVVGTAAGGGWKSFGPSRRVTKAESNVLYELDGKPALQLYKQYLGDKMEGLPASGLFYPFAILQEDRSATGLIRTILDVNQEEESLTFAGDIAEGSLVRLMHSDTDDLVEGAKEAAERAGVSDDKDQDAIALLVSCIGRKLIMGEDVDEEIEIVREEFGEHAAIGGFYSYGEICDFFATCSSELHNQTMTITHITERE